MLRALLLKMWQSAFLPIVGAAAFGGSLVLLLGFLLRPHSTNQAPVEVAARNQLNLILISLDTLRADRLGTYGYNRNTSPAIDKLARRGVVFEHTWSVSSWTLPSHVTMLTGIYPSSHQITHGTGLRIAPHIKLLAEILQDEGYRTFAYTGGSKVSRRYGFGRGFEIYDSKESTRMRGLSGLAKSIALAQAKIDSLAPQEPFFLFLHTYDIHCPYSPPEPYFSMYAHPAAKPIDPHSCGQASYNRKKLTPGEVHYLSDRYDGGIRWADQNLSTFFEFLKERDLMRNTVIVVTSDHGEEFYEHGRIGHQRSLHSELLKVPLVIVAPGIMPGRVTQSVSLVDIFPSVLQLLGFKPHSQSQGHSVVALLHGERKELPFRNFQLAELDRGVRLRSRIGEKYQLILNLDKKQRVQLFDLHSDPLQQNDLAHQLAAVVTDRRSQLQRFLDGLQQNIPQAVEATLSNEEVDRLKTLGYL